MVFGGKLWLSHFILGLIAAAPAFLWWLPQWWQEECLWKRVYKITLETAGWCWVRAIHVVLDWEGAIASLYVDSHNNVEIHLEFWSISCCIHAIASALHTCYHERPRHLNSVAWSWTALWSCRLLSCFHSVVLPLDGCLDGGWWAGFGHRLQVGSGPVKSPTVALSGELAYVCS